MSVQRSIGSKVAAWITRVPPAIGSRRHHHSLSKPEPVTRSRNTDSGRASRLSTRAVLAQQPEACPRRAGRRGGGPRRDGGPEPQLREQDEADARIVERRPDDPRRGLDEDPSLDDPLAAQVVAGAAIADLGVRTDGHRAQTPIGCQTVFISRKAAIHSGRSAARSSSQSNRASRDRRADGATGA